MQQAQAQQDSVNIESRDAEPQATSQEQPQQLDGDLFRLVGGGVSTGPRSTGPHGTW